MAVILGQRFGTGCEHSNVVERCSAALSLRGIDATHTTGNGKWGGVRCAPYEQRDDVSQVEVMGCKADVVQYFNNKFYTS